MKRLKRVLVSPFFCCLGPPNTDRSGPAVSWSVCIFAPAYSSLVPQRKIDETEAERQRYEQQRDALKTKIHNLNSIDMKVHPSFRGTTGSGVGVVGRVDI